MTLTNKQLMEARRHIIAAQQILNRADIDTKRKTGVPRVVSAELKILGAALRRSYR